MHFKKFISLKRWKSERTIRRMSHHTSGDAHHDACLCNGHSDMVNVETL